VHAAGQLSVDATGGGARLTGAVAPVSWGGQAQLLVLDVVYDGTVHVATIVPPHVAPERAGIAGTPAIAAFDLDDEPAVHFVDTGLEPEQGSNALARRAALARSVALSAALQRTAELTIRYAAQREQFGQPIDRFQAVQGHLARLASEAQRAAVLVDAARARAADGRVLAFGSVAASRVLTGEAAAVAARTAHQVHGAIGVTMEYVLQRYTRRLWEWSLADSGTARWARELGRRACTSDLGAWQLITDTDTDAAPDRPRG
jgi:acyl-CoA dehydrogenase